MTSTAGSKDTPETADEVEPFNNSKTPSPKNKTKQKETISDGPLPEPSAYVAAVDDHVDVDIDRLSSIGTPFGGSPQSSASPDVHEDNNRGLTLSPGYKLENETRKIGGFDPEAFRKANANNKGNNQPAGDSWAQPVPSKNSFQQQQQNTGGHTSMGGGNGGDFNTGGGSNGGGFHHRDGGETGNGFGNVSHGNAGGGDRWGSSGQGDYIQSEDIFSSQSPQAMQNSSSMNFRDDPLTNDFMNSDPFRSPGGMGHNPTQQPREKLITHEDDALMDDILGELDEL